MPSLPGRSASKTPVEGTPGSDLHQCDLEAFHHALHVENEGVLI